MLDCGEPRGVIGYGTSYGSYLAAPIGVLHPERGAGIIPDSAMLDARSPTETARKLHELN